VNAQKKGEIRFIELEREKVIANERPKEIKLMDK
jgi:hypothetical protein